MAKVYVGNLSWNTTDDGLAHAFSPYGQLTDYIVMKDRDTGRSRGFGFVTFMTQQEADAAIAALNEQELDGRRIRVNMANSRPPMGGMGANLGYSGLTGGYGAGAYGAAQAGYGAYAGAQPANFAYGQQAGYGGYQQQPYGAQPAGYPAPQAYPAQQGGFAAYGAQQPYGAPAQNFQPPQPPQGGAGYGGQGY
ncbi:uncharacterized protein MJAP1_000559 [Malassezia japonica]|uniref:RRM domain-containing protein n=1 Tax=Malassezia japonica TaxID=223818 RepID=A0AAF0F3A9_9BASI|nr:uncharacterized protein MJAP1_000559 [Malassezia japonica]WFD37612.1 hypothetical protein MJAP1_000559 [Malassezia japonica]